MNPIRIAVSRFSEGARARRASLFRRSFHIGPDTKILDLGSENGKHIWSVLQGTCFEPSNVYIADIEPEAVAEGSRRFGFLPVAIGESGSLPFPDRFFDIVHCSSVIEHVTVPKEQVWLSRNGRDFRAQSEERQRAFAAEIKRVGNQYFVQTPNRWFPVESHTWLPFLGWLPRRMLLPVLRVINRFWVKTTQPDWRLLGPEDVSRLFGGAQIIKERFWGLTKSVVAIESSVDHERSC